MKKQTIKNPESPGGRRDWEKRTPRQRVSLTVAQLAILKEWAEDFFNRHPEKRIHPLYSDLYERIAQHIEAMDKPLMASSYTSPLFDKEIKFGEEG